MPLLWLGGGAACLADGGGKLVGGVEPAYTICLSARPSCKSLVRTQFRLQYRQRVSRTFSVRLRLARAYQLTLDDDKEAGSSEEQAASKLQPPFDVVDLKLRFGEANGRDRIEMRTGYAYQHSQAGLSNGYHTAYISVDYYFGAPMASGWGGLSRRFDVLVKVSQNLYAAIDRPEEELTQFVQTYTLPLNADGSTRAYGSYARELRLAGSNNVRAPSNRFEVGAYRDATRWLQFYGRISVFATRGLPGASKIVLGIDIAI
ncbi:MAG: hypothetical protein JO104_06900 [Candidatus Eremiobacteraeota bacterium]|nr:hypothetical protein [Candidatus Eremiobacteraeota bacterium]